MKSQHLLNSLLCAAMVTAGLTACNGDVIIDRDIEPQPEEGYFTFRLADPDAYLTRATTAGTGDENGKTTDKVRVYAFDSNNLLQIVSDELNTDREGQRYSVPLLGMRGEGRFFVLRIPMNTDGSYSYPTVTTRTTTISDFTALTTTALASGTKIAAPFIMSNSPANGQSYVRIRDVANQSTDVSVPMQRRVARFDVNMPTDMPAGVTATINKVEIKNAAPKVPYVVQDPVRPTNGTTVTYTETDLTAANKTFYLYPTVITKDATTAAEEKGTEIILTITLAGTGVTQPEPREYVLRVGNRDKAIKGNSKYAINVNIDGLDMINLTLTVEPWNDEDPIGSNVNDPTYTFDIAAANTAAEAKGITISEANNLITVDYENIDLGTDPSFELNIPYTTYNTGYAADEWLTAEAMTGSASAPVELVELTSDMLKLKFTPATSSDWYINGIILKDPEGNIIKKVQILNVPDYPATDREGNPISGLKPVLVNGTWWAPVNVGATELPAESEMGTGPITAAMAGNFYQYGRNVAFPITGAGGNTIRGPLTPEAAAATEAFITSSAHWRNPFDNNLWANAEDTPCPTGWRLPTKAEANVLIPKLIHLGTGTTATQPRWSKAVSEAGTLYIPGTGVLSSGNGFPTGIGDRWHLWVYDAGATAPGRIYLYANQYGTDNYNNSALGENVRCVQ